ncbi:MAG: hypothetical protein HOE62_02025 [Alphaproteobacteria bacterium]|jgi:triacylglycerol lipase|nr:hypothetical protein [Alphaproteobacteria bacterium]MBT4016697.1 hypothetical protein [Alphaproteobacteria bacterium]MBT4966611.1 hypothetical protein [Alphaproteobacteria bacterium]MBT5159888.1 hypothetical protein [Alphaproteobacteria bacterium]MBT6384501.1 hypothetical protein [Alphaproteobacteria bacterium]
MQDYFSNSALLKTPGKRAAYSDRTAYLMAEMSRLAYFRFEGGSNVADIIESLKTFLPENSNLTAITSILASSIVPTNSADGRKLLEEILKPHDFELLNVFNSSHSGAQAFLCRHTSDNFAVLAFRGTEQNLKDIKADVKANLQKVKIGGKEF